MAFIDVAFIPCLIEISQFLLNALRENWRYS